jgi:hypothetical protein
MRIDLLVAKKGPDGFVDLTQELLACSELFFRGEG